VSRKHWVILFLVILASEFLRLYKLPTLPPFLYCDEISFAWNAKSILKTGKDEFGQFLPLSFRAFDDWRPPLYIYLTSVSLKIFGVNDFAVRAPSALAGISFLIIFYLFIKDFINQKVAIVGTFLAAFNPTLILLSRTALDSNVALFFTVGFFWLFFKGIQQKRIIWITSSLVAASLAVLGYQGSKIFVPLMLIVLILSTWSQLITLLKKRKNFLFIGLGIFIFTVSLFISVFSAKNIFRFTSISIFNQEYLLKTSISRLTLNKEMGLSIFNLLANRRLLFFQEGVLRYLDNFSPSFLFAPKTYSSLYNLPNFGIFPFFELIFFIIGLFVLFGNSIVIPDRPKTGSGIYKNKFINIDSGSEAGMTKKIKPGMTREKKIFLVSWLVLAPLPAAPITFAPQITRILPIVPVIVIITSFGLVKVWERFPGLVALVYIGSIFLLLWSLFIVLPTDNIIVRQPYYQQMVREAYKIKGEYQKVYVSNSLKMPYIYFLWYGNYDPVVYLARGRLRGGSGLNPEDEFANFSFLQFSLQIFQKKGRNLYIGQPDDFPQNISVINKIGCETNDREECIWFGEI
jgi:4-amino-4-deoxy-L-arabinose transferase-like glycosyltransferase